MSYSSEVLADSPSFYFRLEEPSGTFSDSSGNGVTMIENGGSVTRSVTGPAAVGGVGVSGGTATSLECSFGGGGIGRLAETIECWVKTTSTAHNRIFNGRRTNGNALMLSIGATGFGAAAGQVSIYFNSTSFWQGKHTSLTVNDGSWHHIAATWSQSTGVAVDPSAITIYVDGTAVSTTLDSGNTGSSTTPIIGENYAFIDSGPLAVSVDELAFYTAALSAGRIATHAVAGVGSTSPRSFAVMVG
jgi:hypothetical protein